MNRSFESPISESIPENPTSDHSIIDKYAPAPFNDSRGDIVLQASDNVKFRILKFILELASPVFRDMFSLPQPSVEDAPGKALIVRVSESSLTLVTLLHFCYPVVRPQLVKCTMTLLGEVLRAAIKYDISVAIEPARKALQERAAKSETDALAAYAIACDLKLEKEARVAANACLKWPALGTSVPQMALMTGLDHYNLLDFQRRAGAAVAELINGHFFTKVCSEILPTLDHDDWSCGCTVSGRDRESRLYKWWEKSKDDLQDVLVNAPLDNGKVSLSIIASNLEQHSCSRCKGRVLQGWEQTKAMILVSIDIEISKVKLAFSWK